ncbi:hypothetical protein [Gordonia lacunae]|uniref:Uncharacterized protein n=1 Tax=Gordonia lacunae TaxID=417102 RepID=A0A243QEC3_9ACTN|nr:hypothetical protein [Gordonia lacunae]OUC79178.1 hypothetical protein CA982_08840 [Gordonia lacunae]
MTDGTPRPDDRGHGDGHHGSPAGSAPADAGAASAGFSIAKLAFYALGTGVLVLIVSVPIIALCAHWSPIAGLVAALVAVAAMIAAIGTVANRMVDRARADLIAARDGHHPA